MALKIDLSEAYDRISRQCIIEVMGMLGFSNKWWDLISACLYDAPISIIINGRACQKFSTSCGVHQGDPVSPYLFLFGMLLLEKEIATKIILEKFSFLGSPYDADVCILTYADVILLFQKPLKSIV